MTTQDILKGISKSIRAGLRLDGSDSYEEENSLPDEDNRHGLTEVRCTHCDMVVHRTTLTGTKDIGHDDHESGCPVAALESIRSHFTQLAAEIERLARATEG